MNDGLESRPHALYRFFNGEQLLYVGITADLGQRWKKHSDDKAWWTEVTNCTVHHYPTRSAVLAAELAAIKREKPRHNITHNDGSPRVLVSSAPTVPAGKPLATPERMPDCCKQCMRQHWDMTVYLPHYWSNGKADYNCIRNHHWVRGWYLDGSGFDDDAVYHSRILLRTL